MQFSHHKAFLRSLNQVSIPLEGIYIPDTQGPSLNFMLFHIAKTILLFIFSFQHTESFSSWAFYILSISAVNIWLFFGFWIANRMTMQCTIQWSKHPL